MKLSGYQLTKQKGFPMNKISRSVKRVMATTLAVAFPLVSSADVDVANARIDRIGLFSPNDTKGAMLQLTDLSANPAWAGSRQFFLSEQVLGQEGLAMTLTAFTMGKPIWVRIAGTAEPLSLITVIYVNAQ